MARYEDKTRENRLRATAKRQGLELRKSRRRDPLAVGYGRYWLMAGDKWEKVRAGGQRGMTIDQVEEWLLTPEEER